MSAPATWYYAIDGTQHGPFPLDELKEMLATSLAPDTLVYAHGVTAEWTAASGVPELAVSKSAPPPPAPPPSTPGQVAHVIDYEIVGDDMQFVVVELDPNETVVAEAGAMMYMEDGISYESRMGDGSKPEKGFFGKVWEGAKRKLTGESLFLTHFTHQGQGKAHVAFGAPYPGRIIPIDLGEVDGDIICQKDAFLCCARGIGVDIALQKRLGAGFFGGEGFIMQRLSGDGLAFMHAGGTVVRRTLKPGEILKVDTGCVVAYESAVNFDIQYVGSLKSAVFGGEGLFFATLTGPGDTWLQSLPFSRLADRVYRAAPQLGGSSKGEGSVLGGLSRIFES